MRTPARITFSDFDTTSEISGLDGSTYIVVTVRLTIEHAGGTHAATASIGISGHQGRRSYELIEPGWLAQPALAEAVMDYVREGERLFRVAPVTGNHRQRKRTVELDVDLSEMET
jgi:hypothetical protein